MACLDCKWLVIYDNVESADLLMPYWPKASHGKAIITTRNHSSEYEPDTSGLETTSWYIKMSSDFLLLLLERNIGSDIQAEGDSTSELSKKLSGHALGISHMAGPIQRRSGPISEFIRICLKIQEGSWIWTAGCVWFSFATLEKLLGRSYEFSRSWYRRTSHNCSSNSRKTAVSQKISSFAPTSSSMIDAWKQRAQLILNAVSPRQPNPFWLFPSQTGQRYSCLFLPSNGANAISIISLSMSDRKPSITQLPWRSMPFPSSHMRLIDYTSSGLSAFVGFSTFSV